MTYYWVDCLSCGERWIAPFAVEFGLLVALSSAGEECQDCGSIEVETGEEYDA